MSLAVPRAWAGETVACLATGPSLCQSDVDQLRGRVRVIAINDAYRLCPWADVLYACDPSWWIHHQGVPSFPGQKWSLDHSQWKGYEHKYPDIQRLRHTGDTGLELDPSGLRSGKNSGFQALGLAVHFGAARILLLGYDMRAPKGSPVHFFGDHKWGPSRPPFPSFLAHFDTLVEPLRLAGVEVFNCTPESDLRCFPCRRLADVLPVEVAA